MAQARAHLPNNLQSVAALKALSKKILKHYVVKRLDHWLSVKGTASDYAKYGVYLASFGNYGSKKTSKNIIDDCSRIKAELEKASKYSDYQNLIKTLVDYAIEAKNAKLPGISSDPLRVDTYFAIIDLIHEIMKIDFAHEYQADITTHRSGYAAAIEDYKVKYESGLELDQVIHEKDEHLRQLVLLGDRQMYSKAFDSHNPFPELFARLQGKASFVDANAIADFTGIIELQLLNEQGWKKEAVKEHMQGLYKPNANLPEQLQPDFAMLYCKNQMNKSLGYATMLAVEDDAEEFGKDFYTVYLANPEKFVAENKPDPMVQRVKSNPDATHADDQMKFLPNDRANSNSSPNLDQHDDLKPDMGIGEDSANTQASDAKGKEEDNTPINTGAVVDKAQEVIDSPEQQPKVEEVNPIKQMGDAFKAGMAEKSRTASPELPADTASNASEDINVSVDLSSGSDEGNVVSLSRSSSTMFRQLDEDGEPVSTVEERQTQEQKTHATSQQSAPSTQRRRKKK